MNNELLIDELTKLYNNNCFEDQRINGLIIKIYGKLRKELHKYINSAVKASQFHKDVATYAAGAIGYYAIHGDLDKYSKVKFVNAFEVLKISNKPLIIKATDGVQNHQNLFLELSSFNKEFDLNSATCHDVFRILQKLYLLKRKQAQNRLGVSHIELTAMSLYFNYRPKIHCWTDSFYGPLCQYDTPKTKVQPIQKSEPIKPSNKVAEPKYEIKKSIWSWFRKQ